jgi:hypothetical protein
VYGGPAAEWKHRYEGWLQDPVRMEMYRARQLFDLRSVDFRSILQILELTGNSRWFATS